MHRLRRGVAFALIFLTVSAQAVQNPVRSGAPSPATAPYSTQPGSAAKTGEPDLKWLQEILADREMMAEIGQIAEKLQKGVHYPGSRNQSRILPRLSDSTIFYAAFHNYGNTMHEASQILFQELTHSPHLQAFMAKKKLMDMQPKVEAFMEKFYQLSQFLGDEVVIEGDFERHDPSVVVVAEIKKPGLREFLEKLNNEWIASKSDRLTILDPQQLAAADPDGRKPAVLIRGDVVAMGFDVLSLRAFNVEFDQAGSKFVSGRLGERLAQVYRSGTTSVVGLDLHKIMATMPRSRQQERAVLEKTGFMDADYLILQNSMSAKGSANEAEVVFSKPRRGIASWLAEPGAMGGLDFVSAHAAYAGDVILKNPAQIFDDLQDIVGESGFAGIRQMETQLNVSLKYDLLSKLGGEIAFETKLPPTAPDAPLKTTFNETDAKITPGAFTLVLRVTDAAGLQQTLEKLLKTAPVEAKERDEGGVTFHSLVVPAPAASPSEINYFFMDGYMIIASDRATAREAVEIHRGGKSMAKSAALRESLFQARSGQASAVFYQDPSQTWEAMATKLPPEMRALLPSNAAIMSKPTLFSIEAEESSFRAFSNSNVQTDTTVALIAAAVAIPSLMRSRASANDAAAASAIRTVNTAQITYATAYPAKGYAPNLATLGPGSGNCSHDNTTPEHACLLNDVLGNGSCVTGKWCEKSGYKFSVRAVCLQGQCPNYVVTAVPATQQAGARSYCSTSDGVVRTNSGAPPESPLTVADCKRWAPVR